MIPPGIKRLIGQAKAQNATDVHVCAGAPILMRVGQDLVPAGQGVVTPELSERIASELLSPDQLEQFHKQLDYDVMVSDEQGRYRVNISYNNRAVGVVIRILPEEARSLDELGLPPVVKELAKLTKGLILITGSTSQGKTSTMSAIIHEINTHQRRHIVTIEDPVENAHINRMSIVRQREVGRDTQSFYTGLRAALRQDPNVIAIGEMRDYETIKTALTAAETGVLVLSTLHIISIDKMIERLLSYVPTEDQGHLRFLLAGAVQAVIHQELIPAVDGSKRVACEILLATGAVRNVIRTRDGFMLRNIIHTGGRHGMISMRQSIDELLAQGAVAPEVAQGVLVNY
ncbi:MAG TPA: PilT/PilU family type 4a pilus ATPase [Phycisphaerae bacterium]|nr:PilT/PilU family type 4a pilus ATPase [Phycisphaerae bacterium]